MVDAVAQQEAEDIEDIETRRQVPSGAAAAAGRGGGDGDDVDIV